MKFNAVGTYRQYLSSNLSPARAPCRSNDFQDGPGPGQVYKKKIKPGRALGSDSARPSPYLLIIFCPLFLDSAPGVTRCLQPLRSVVQYQCHPIGIWIPIFNQIKPINKPRKNICQPTPAHLLLIMTDLLILLPLSAIF